MITIPFQNKIAKFQSDENIVVDTNKKPGCSQASLLEDGSMTVYKKRGSKPLKNMFPITNTPADIVISLVDQNCLIVGSKLGNTPGFGKIKKIPLLSLLDTYQNSQIWNSLYLNRTYDIRIPKSDYQKLTAETALAPSQRQYFFKVAMKRKPQPSHDYGLEIPTVKLACYSTNVHTEKSYFNSSDLTSWQQIKNHVSFLQKTFDRHRQSILRNFQYPKSQNFQYKKLKFKKVVRRADNKHERICDLNIQIDPFVKKSQTSLRTFVPKTIASVDLSDDFDPEKCFKSDILAVNDNGKSYFMSTNSNF